jgi:hypothetical protein
VELKAMFEENEENEKYTYTGWERRQKMKAGLAYSKGKVVPGPKPVTNHTGGNPETNLDNLSRKRLFKGDGWGHGSATKNNGRWKDAV